MCVSPSIAFVCNRRVDNLNSSDKSMSTLKTRELKKQPSKQASNQAHVQMEMRKVYPVKPRNYVSTYLGDDEIAEFNSVLMELGIAKAALGKALIRIGLKGLRRPISAKQALNLITLGKLN